MEKIKNPFEILGIERKDVLNLDSGQLAGFIKERYRQLSVKYHPDRNPGDKSAEQMFKDVAAAYDIISDSETRDYFKAKLMKRTTLDKRVEELEDALVLERHRTRGFYGQLVDYFSCARDESLNILNMAPCILRMHDYSMNMKRSVFSRTKKSSGDQVFFDLIVRRDGTIVRRQNRKTQEIKDKILIGTIHSDVSNENGGLKNILRLTQPIFTYEDAAVKTKLLGTSLYGDIREYENRISPDSFQSIMHFITPKIIQYGALFSLNRDANGDYFMLDGQITLIVKR